MKPEKYFGWECCVFLCISIVCGMCVINICTIQLIWGACCESKVVRRDFQEISIYV